MPPNEHLGVVQRRGTNDDVVAVERRCRDAATDSRCHDPDAIPARPKVPISRSW
jgi:hypothetical protein